MCFITTFVEHPVWLGERKGMRPEVWGQMTVLFARQSPGSYPAGCRFWTRLQLWGQEWNIYMKGGVQGWGGLELCLERWWAGPGALLTWKPPKSSGMFYGHNFIHIKHTYKISPYYHKRKQFNWKLEVLFSCLVISTMIFKNFTYFNMVN